MQHFSLIPTAHAASTNLSDYYAFGKVNSLGDLFSTFADPALSIAGLLLLFYLLYSSFKYITSGGNKEVLASARGQIVHAIIGIVMLLMMFLILRALPTLLGLTGFQLVK